MSHPRDTHFELTPNDQRILDDLIEASFDIEAMEPLSDAERQRAVALCDLFGLLNDYPVEDADDTLLHATLARINRHDGEQMSRMQLDPALVEPAKLRGGRRLPIPDFISIAAVILIALGIGWPVFNQMRNRSVVMQCANNMRVLVQAFNNYASDYGNAMPAATAGFGTSSWDQVRNIINLRPLVENNYCDHNHLNCPGNHDHYGSSYSYQWQPPSVKMLWDTGHTLVILGDRNPLVDATISGNVVPANSMSINHDERGQNVLMSDGTIRWLIEPMIGQDNIWLPKGVLILQTGQQPADASDAFLVH